MFLHRDTERDIHTPRHADMHAVSQSNTCRDRHIYIHFWQAATVRQTGRHIQPYRSMHSYTLRYMQIQAESAYTGSYMQKLTETDIDRHRQTQAGRDIHRQTKTDRDMQSHTETYIDRQRYTYREREPNIHIHAD